MSITTALKVSLPSGAKDAEESRPVDPDDPGSVGTVICPTRGWIPVDWREVVQAREVLYTLVARDIKVRYQQTVLGVGWALIQPLFTMFIFTMIFGRFVKIDTDGMAYPIFVFAGLVPWNFFLSGVNAASTSLISQLDYSWRRPRRQAVVEAFPRWFPC